jgi:hypothetical protein
MLIAILPLVAMSSEALTTAAVDLPTPSSARAAQVQLADALANAETIDMISCRDHTFTFVITRDAQPVDLIATSNDAGDVIKLVERDRSFDQIGAGSLSWLADTMRETVAVTRLEVDEDGAVTLTTDEGMRYMAIPGRGSGGNAAAEARWAGDWDRDDVDARYEADHDEG